jgi:hypothetical protein
VGGGGQRRWRRWRRWRQAGVRTEITSTFLVSPAAPIDGSLKNKKRPRTDLIYTFIAITFELYLIFLFSTFPPLNLKIMMLTFTRDRSFLYRSVL